MNDVYVLGIDMIKFGRFPEKTVPQLGATAALMALDDAGLTIQDMQALYCGNLGQANAMVGQRVLQEIGQTGIARHVCAVPEEHSIRFTTRCGQADAGGRIPRDQSRSLLIEVVVVYEQASTVRGVRQE